MIQKKAGWLFAILFCINASGQIHTLSLLDIYNSKNLEKKEKEDSIKQYLVSLSPLNQLNELNKLVKVAERKNDNYWLYISYYRIGNSYCYLADAENASKSYLKALKKAEKANVKEAIYGVYIGLGNAYTIGENYKNAIKYYRSAIALLNDSSDLEYKGYIILNLVNQMQLTKNNDSIYYYLNKADSIFKTSNNSFGKAYVYGNWALLHAKRNNFMQADYELNRCIKLLETSGSQFDIVAFKIEMVKILITQKEFTLAYNYCVDVYAEALEVNLKAQIRDAAQLLAQIYSQQGDYQRAFEYQTTYLAYKDSISNEETIRKMADLRTEYEVSQKQQEIDLLEEKRFYSRIALAGAGAVVLTLATLLFIIRKYNKTIKKQRRRLIQQKIKLKKLNDTKDKMFSIISHDLRGPIHSLAGLSPIMDELIIKQEHNALLEINATMRNSLNQTSNLLDNLLEWAICQQGNISLKAERFDACGVLNNLKEIFIHSAMAKNISLEIQIDEPVYVFADKNTFATIFRNLVANAIKFTKEGGNVQLSCNQHDHEICFVVADTGVGLTPEKVATLFDFKHTESTWGTNQEKGIGLGLRLAYDFTKLNNGAISVDSEVGKGTRFVVCLPME